jgi:hypothetical protein
MSAALARSAIHVHTSINTEGAVLWINIPKSKAARNLDEVNAFGPSNTNAGRMYPGSTSAGSCVGAGSGSVILARIDAFNTRDEGLHNKEGSRISLGCREGA